MTWTRWKAERKRPPGNWRQFGSVTHVAGLAHRIRQARAFCTFAFANGHAWLTLVREPTNEHDPNAIAVYGHWTSERARWFRSPAIDHHAEQIGYLPAEEAELLGTVDREMPIAAELYGIDLAPPDDDSGMLGVIIKIIVLVPSATDPHWGRVAKTL